VLRVKHPPYVLAYMIHHLELEIDQGFATARAAERIDSVPKADYLFAESSPDATPASFVPSWPVALTLFFKGNYVQHA